MASDPARKSFIIVETKKTDARTKIVDETFISRHKFSEGYGISELLDYQVFEFPQIMLIVRYFDISN